MYNSHFFLPRVTQNLSTSKCSSSQDIWLSQGIVCSRCAARAAVTPQWPCHVTLPIHHRYSLPAHWEPGRGWQRANHWGNRRVQGTLGSCCHGGTALVGGIRPNTAEENVKATSPTVTKRMQRKGTGQRFSDCVGRRGVWEAELKPRGEPQKTSEGVREEQCRGPWKRQSVPGGDERGWVRPSKTREVKSRPAATGLLVQDYVRTRSWEFLPSEQKAERGF